MRYKDQLKGDADVDDDMAAFLKDRQDLICKHLQLIDLSNESYYTERSLSLT